MLEIVQHYLGYVREKGHIKTGKRFGQESLADEIHKFTSTLHSKGILSDDEFKASNIDDNVIRRILDGERKNGKIIYSLPTSEVRVDAIINFLTHPDSLYKVAVRSTFYKTDQSIESASSLSNFLYDEIEIDHEYIYRFKGTYNSIAQDINYDFYYKLDISDLIMDKYLEATLYTYDATKIANTCKEALASEAYKGWGIVTPEGFLSLFLREIKNDKNLVLISHDDYSEEEGIFKNISFQRFFGHYGFLSEDGFSDNFWLEQERNTLLFQSVK